MRFRIFISSVQREFAAERQMIAEYVRKDALLGKFFDVFLFEEEPACDVEARDLYLPEVEKSDIYLGILGAQFGNADAEGVSPTEREYDLATIKGKERLVFVKKCERDPREERFLQKVQSDVVRKSFEIMNPGTLPRGWTAATLLTTHESVARNKVIAKALDWAGYVERSGHGTEFIIEKCEAQGLATPQYKPDSAIFHTIIWRKTAERAVAQSNGPVAHQVAYDVAYQVAYQNVPSNTAGRTFLILKDGPLGRADIAKAIGVTRMARSLKLALDTLMEDGLIEYTIPNNVRSRLQKYRLTEKGRQMLGQNGTRK